MCSVRFENLDQTLPGDCVCSHQGSAIYAFWHQVKQLQDKEALFHHLKKFHPLVPKLFSLSHFEFQNLMIETAL
jgi:hypothetical protein